MAAEPLIIGTDCGLYCPAGNFHIDAWGSVERSIVTHAHSDHARRGPKRYLTSTDGGHVLRQRMGADAAIDLLDYGHRLDLNGVTLSLHPAGHVLGSAEVRVEYQGQVWIVTGDYKRQPDATCQPFEVVRCDTLITECTFGLPIFRWRDPADVARQINDWWRQNANHGRTSLMLAYSLGKAQRVMSLLDPAIGPILLHGAVDVIASCYRETGVPLPPSERATVERAKACRGKAMVICPPAAADSPWERKFAPLSLGVASGWMQVRGFRRRQSADVGFVLSDHADWPGLLQTVRESGASHVIATHGYTQQFARYLNEIGIQASVYKTRFTDAGEEEGLRPEESASEET